MIGLSDKMPLRTAYGDKMKEKESAPGGATVRRSVFLGLLALSYLQYYFLGVLTEIDSLPTVIVFAPAKTVG